MSADIIETHGGVQDRLVMLIITQACNCSCRYCYETHKSQTRMSAETAREVLEHEFKTAAGKGAERLHIDFMGGEPLLNFELIRSICEWLWEREWPLTYSVFARTNGLLLNDEMRGWLAENHERFSLGLSMDGLPDMHRINRSSDLPDTSFFLKYWPQQPIKMTLFPDSIHLLAESVISFHEQGIPLTATLGEGFPWSNQAVAECERQLQQLVDFYISHPDIAPIEPLLDDRYLRCFPNDSLNNLTFPMCGDATGIVAYDCDGTEYRCHMFSPVCLGREQAARAKQEILEDACIAPDPNCANCPARFVCRRCPGLDYKLFRSTERSANKLLMCQLIRSTMKASADICIGRFAVIQRQRELSEREMQHALLALKLSDSFSTPQ